MRIFISSTAVDLLGYREKVRDAVLRMNSLPVAMETFSASPQLPATECLTMAADADAVICIVGQRYGYTPSREFGGDAERSITWLEVDAARRAGKPVFAFLISSDSQPERVEHQEGEAVNSQKFKAFLQREMIAPTIGNPDELATHVTAALAKLNHETGSTGRVWAKLFCSGLQAAPNFRGRHEKLRDLKEWLEAPVSTDRVLSVVAAGGTGKTALVDQALHQANFSKRAGLLVWSFYEQPEVEKFLRVAYEYFTGKEDAPTSGLPERLQMALSGDQPHVLVLDGLERVQCDEGLRRRGELEDVQLKRLLVSMAGGLGAARALVTSRFPLVDLEERTGAGYRSIVLEDLERGVAIDVLRAWKVPGDEQALTRLIEPLNLNRRYHALSVAVMVSYYHNYPDAPEFSLEDAAEGDTKATRLSLILEQYAKALTKIERDVLARLALFPRGVKVEFLEWIGQSDKKVAGALKGLPKRKLVSHLDRLQGLGLVFRYGSEREAVYSAHPFLREFFRSLIGTEPESVHESIRANLAPSLEGRPDSKPTETGLLDQYELLIEETLLAGRIREAFDLYWFALGGWRNLGLAIGENTRGLRIVERFVPRADFSRIETRLTVRQQATLVNDLGLFAANLGDLPIASSAFAHSRRLYTDASDQLSASATEVNLAQMEYWSGHFSAALQHSEGACSLGADYDAGLRADVDKELQTGVSLAYRAAAHFALGRIAAATADFQHATELFEKMLAGLAGIWEAESKALRGDRTGALSQTRTNRDSLAKYGPTLCRCDALLCRLLLPEAPVEAASHLEKARAFATRSGEIELQLRCFQAACELSCQLGDYTRSIEEGEGGVLLADTCGFGKLSIDLRIALAETYLAAGHPREALQKAAGALDRSERSDCQYAWGKLDGLRLCGVAHQRLGETEQANLRWTAEHELREQLGLTAR